MNATPVPVRARLRYRFDATVARGSGALIAWLAMVTITLISLASAILVAAGIATGDGRTGFVEDAWLALMHAIDTGNLSNDHGWPWRIVALGVTLGGIFIVSTLIGLITSGIDQRLVELRKGRGLVVESDHTLVLGWSPKIHAIVSEIAIANVNQRDGCIVVMAPRDTVEMEDEIRERAPDLGPTRIVCRTGDPASLLDLERVAPLAARSVIVLAPGGEAPDAQVVKAVLALLRLDPGLRNVHVVAELVDPRNASALGRATGDRVATVVSSDVIARVTAQICRSSGLSLVLQDLLDFDGDEIYFQEEPALVGATFGQSLLAYETSSVIGVCRTDGGVELRPALDRPYAAGERVIAISRDDDTVVIGAVPQLADSPACGEGTPIELVPERTLVVGWNPLGPRVVRELDRYVSAGSHLHLLVDPAFVDDAELQLDGVVANQAVAVTHADTTSHEALAQLLQSEPFDQIVVLGYRHGLHPDDADAKTLLTLLQIEAMRSNGGPNADARLVAELLDQRAVDLAQAGRPDDTVVSERMTSLVLAQLSENAGLRAVLDDLFDAEGAELSVQPIARYFDAPAPVPFADAVRAAARFGEVAVGYRLVSGRSQPLIALNPPKSPTVDFGAGDSLVVLA